MQILWKIISFGSVHSDLLHKVILSICLLNKLRRNEHVSGTVKLYACSLSCKLEFWLSVFVYPYSWKLLLQNKFQYLLSRNIEIYFEAEVEEPMKISDVYV